MRKVRYCRKWEKAGEVGGRGEGGGRKEILSSINSPIVTSYLAIFKLNNSYLGIREIFSIFGNTDFSWEIFGTATFSSQLTLFNSSSLEQICKHSRGLLIWNWVR